MKSRVKLVNHGISLVVMKLGVGCMDWLVKTCIITIPMTAYARKPSSPWNRIGSMLLDESVILVLYIFVRSAALSAPSRKGGGRRCGVF